jgi:hypothetical protein
MQNALASECVNLSHEYTLGWIHIRKLQHGCEKWSSVQVLDGNPISTPADFTFSPNWSVQEVDDEYEKTESRYFTNWNRDKTVLLNEYTISSVNKKSGESTFTAVSRQYSLSENGSVQIRGAQIVRKETQEGKVEINTTPILEIWPRLP